MIQIRNIFSLVLLLVVLKSCIEPYDYLIGDGESVFVVYGNLTNEEGYQVVSISMSSEVYTNEYTNQNDNPPVTECIVKIFDDNGNEFLLDEFQDGKYRAWIDQEFLIPGTSYKVEVETPSGVEIVSDFDCMMECPDVRAVYYDVFSDVPEPQQGVQFYIDFNGMNTNCQFVKWDIEETWEYHSVYPVQDYLLDGIFFSSSPPDLSKFICWRTRAVKDIFVLSTKNLTQNVFDKSLLHFVQNDIPKFKYCYSMLINQYSLSEPAYEYWDKLRKTNMEQAGMYDKQPIILKGNMHNITNSEQEVLGFFYASAIQLERIFVTDVHFQNENNVECDFHYHEDFTSFYTGGPYYFTILRDSIFQIPSSCVDCTILGGTTIKPDYWP